MILHWDVYGEPAASRLAGPEPCVRTFPPLVGPGPDFRDQIIEEQRARIMALEEKLADLLSIERTAAKIEEIRLMCIRQYERGRHDGRNEATKPDPNHWANWGPPVNGPVEKRLKRLKKLDVKARKLAAAINVGDTWSRMIKCKHSTQWCYNYNVHPGLVHRECWDAYCAERMTGQSFP